jgi:hypothetical protein
MGAVLFWLGVGLVIALVLLAAWAVDRRARRRGHHVRHGSDILREAWEHGRDADMSGNAFYLGQDLSWMSRSRHTEAAPEAGPSATAAQSGDAVPRGDDCRRCRPHPHEEQPHPLGRRKCSGSVSAARLQDRRRSGLFRQ